MNLEFFIVGGVIFSVYMYFTLWNIYYSSKKQRENNYPNYNQPDTMDMDGMGNYGRFPKIDTTNPKNKVKRDSKKK
ncbi:hypothetical protein [Polaribacter sp.]|uniref:hypothetical protein n=1 Tax=Polaribacter sp. TaxID=1920175 RepID=UPI0025FA68E9|nr:hypothetical protein [Polaribacter sp.]